MEQPIARYLPNRLRTLFRYVTSQSVVARVKHYGLIAIGIGLIAYYLLVVFSIVPRSFAACDEGRTYLYFERCPQYDALSYLLWSLFNLLDRHAEAVLSLATIGLFIYTFRLWKSTVQMADRAHENARIELKAYISLNEEPKGRMIALDEKALIQAIIKNNGKTPAYRVSCLSDIVLLPKDIRKKSRLPRLKTHGIVITEADIPADGGYILETKSDFAVDKVILANVCGFGNDRLYLYGVLKFDDAFEDSWTVEFCYQIQVGPDGSVKGWHVSPFHNETKKRAPRR